MNKRADKYELLGAGLGAGAGGYAGKKLMDRLSDNTLLKALGTTLGAGAGGYAGYKGGQAFSEMNEKTRQESITGESWVQQNRRPLLHALGAVAGAGLGAGTTRYVGGFDDSTTTGIGAAGGAGLGLLTSIALLEAMEPGKFSKQREAAVQATKRWAERNPGVDAESRNRYFNDELLNRRVLYDYEQSIGSVATPARKAAQKAISTGWQTLAGLVEGAPWIAGGGAAALAARNSMRVLRNTREVQNAAKLAGSALFSAKANPLVREALSPSLVEALDNAYATPDLVQKAVVKASPGSGFFKNWFSIAKANPEFRVEPNGVVTNINQKALHKVLIPLLRNAAKAARVR